MAAVLEAGSKVFGRAVQKVAYFFYAGNNLLASTRPEWLKRLFDILAGIFDRVGLRTNYGKMFGMVCKPFRAVGNNLKEAYEKRMTGEGLL